MNGRMNLLKAPLSKFAAKVCCQGFANGEECTAEGMRMAKSGVAACGDVHLYGWLCMRERERERGGCPYVKCEKNEKKGN